MRVGARIKELCAALEGMGCWSGRVDARQHWSKLARAKKAYRAACAWTAKEQGAQRIEAERLHLTLVFVPPNRRAHDLDELKGRA